MSDKQNLQPTRMLESGTLWQKVKERTESALKCGALHSIPTEYEFVDQEGICFLVRSLSNLDRKEVAKQQQDKKTTRTGKDFNPFLPYEEELFVADLSETHLCLLNKFNVVDYHLLIVTREFEEQENLLTLADFEAMWAVFAEMDGLAFYNGGKLAGASQRHKHLQVVPLPIAFSGPPIPIASAIAAAVFEGTIGTLPNFEFVHAFMKLDFSEKYVSEAAHSTLKCYSTLLDAVGLCGDLVDAYNLLITRDWMLIVPRSQEHFESIAVNSLGFAGTFFVRNQELLKLLKDSGPLTVLRKVAKPLSVISHSI